MVTLELKLVRRELNYKRTIGDLYIDGEKFCNTLEDTVREPGVKVPGATAIPSGRYEVRLTYSNRFRQVMPQLMNVPMFDGIRIHSGNTEADTEGCLLVGRQDGQKVIDSRDTYNDLMDILEKCKVSIYITITNS